MKSALANIWIFQMYYTVEYIYISIYVFEDSKIDNSLVYNADS